MLREKLKDGDTFYYILTCHHSDENGKDYVTNDVFAYEFHEGDDNSETSFYDLERMFNTKEEAEQKAKSM